MNLSKAPSAREVAEEVQKLRELRPKVERFQSSGEDAWLVIDAQIDVLENTLDQNEILGMYGDTTSEEFDEHELNGALNACKWVEGDELVSPSEHWSLFA